MFSVSGSTKNIQPAFLCFIKIHILPISISSKSDKLISVSLLFVFISTTNLSSQTKTGADALGSRKYDEYKTPQFCGSS